MAALCSNNTNSCYNRLVLLIVALAMCQLGGQVTWLKSMVNTLASMTHHIQMVYGNLKIGQKHKDWVEPLGKAMAQGHRFGQQ